MIFTAINLEDKIQGINADWCPRPLHIPLAVVYDDFLSTLGKDSKVLDLTQVSVKPDFNLMGRTRNGRCDYRHVFVMNGRLVKTGLVNVDSASGNSETERKVAMRQFRNVMISIDSNNEDNIKIANKTLITVLGKYNADKLWKEAKAREYCDETNIEYQRSRQRSIREQKFIYFGLHTAITERVLNFNTVLPPENVDNWLGYFSGGSSGKFDSFDTIRDPIGAYRDWAKLGITVCEHDYCEPFSGDWKAFYRASKPVTFKDLFEAGLTCPSSGSSGSHGFQIGYFALRGSEKKLKQSFQKLIDITDARKAKPKD